jgi:hypothetical protein
MTAKTFLCASLLAALSGCGDLFTAPPGPKPPQTPQEEIANKSPQQYCVNVCLSQSGSVGLASDVKFCEDQCTY